MENRTNDLSAFLTSVISSTTIGPQKSFDSSSGSSLERNNKDVHRPQPPASLLNLAQDSLPGGTEVGLHSSAATDRIANHNAYSAGYEASRLLEHEGSHQDYRYLETNTSALGMLDSSGSDQSFLLEEAEGNNITTSLVDHIYSEFSDRSIPLSTSAEHDNHEAYFHCLETFISKKMSDSHDPSACQIKFDGASCWPETPAGTLSTISCFAEFYGVPYDTSRK